MGEEMKKEEVQRLSNLLREIDSKARLISDFQYPLTMLRKSDERPRLSFSIDDWCSNALIVDTDLLIALFESQIEKYEKWIADAENQIREA